MRHLTFILVLILTELICSCRKDNEIVKDQFQPVIYKTSFPGCKLLSTTDISKTDTFTSYYEYDNQNRITGKYCLVKGVKRYLITNLFVKDSLYRTTDNYPTEGGSYEQIKLNASGFIEMDTLHSGPGYIFGINFQYQYSKDGYLEIVYDKNYNYYGVIAFKYVTENGDRVIMYNGTYFKENNNFIFNSVSKSWRYDNSQNNFLYNKFKEWLIRDGRASNHMPYDNGVDQPIVFQMNSNGYPQKIVYYDLTGNTTSTQTLEWDCK